MKPNNDNRPTNDSIVTKSSRYSTDRTTDGLISRQDAIKEAYPVSIDGEVFDVVQVETLMGLPSAQPETIIESDESIKLQNSNDTISRQAAVDAIAKMMPKSYTPDGSHPADEEIFRAQEIFADCIKTIEILPSAQPEVIRCKDCKYMTEHYDTDGNVPYWTCSEWDSGTDYDGFCHYAERRTDDEQRSS